MKNDITLNGNIIGGRQGFAYICNSRKYPVVKIDLEAPQEYDDYKTFGKIRVLKSYKDRDLVVTSTVEYEKGEGFSLGGHGTCITSSFSFNDMEQLVEEANLQAVREGDIIALAMTLNSIKFMELALYRVGKVDIHCTTIANLIPLTDEEMKEVKADVDAWCN
jgi:hypothetical protein